MEAYIPGLGAACWTSGKIPRGTAETTNNHTDKVTTTYCNRFMFSNYNLKNLKKKIANNSNRENQFKNNSGKIKLYHLVANERRVSHCWFKMKEIVRSLVYYHRRQLVNNLWLCLLILFYLYLIKTRKQVVLTTSNQRYPVNSWFLIFQPLRRWRSL